MNSLLFRLNKWLDEWFDGWWRRKSLFEQGEGYAIAQLIAGATAEALKNEANSAFEFNDFNRGILAVVDKAPQRIGK